MDWSDVRIFLAVVRAGTLGGAARALKLSHPTIGRRLQAFEEATGQILFQRTSEGFVLTDEGAAILPLAEQMEENALALERRLAGEGEELEGVLRLSSADWFGAYVLPPVLAEFSRLHPGVTVELHASSALFNLARREADLVFRIIPIEGPDLIQRRAMNMHYAAYAAAALPDPVPGDGRDQRIISMANEIDKYADVRWLRQKLPNAKMVFGSNSRGVQAQMCAAGVGLAVLPRAVGDATPGLRRLDLGEPAPSREIWLGYHRDLRRLARLRAFLDVTLSVFAAEKDRWTF